MSVNDGAEILKNFQSDVAGKMQEKILRYDPKKDKIYVLWTVVLVARRNAWVTTIVRCLVKKTKRGG